MSLGTKIKIAVVFILLCAVAVEAAFLIPRIKYGMNEIDVMDDIAQPAGPSTLSYDSTDGLAGVAAALRSAQQTYQEKSTAEVASYIDETTATESARVEQAQAKAQAKADFLEEQRRLARELARIRKEQAAAQTGASLNTGTNPGYEEYLAGLNGALGNSSSLTDINSSGSAGGSSGSTSIYDPNTGVWGDGEYVYVPTVPSASGDGNLVSGEAGGQVSSSPATGTPATGGTLVGGNTASVGTPVTNDSYLGEYVATFVCTCKNCFDPKTWPESRLISTFALVPTPYITPDTAIRVDGGLGGHYDTEDGDQYVSGRQILLFHADHSMGAGDTTAYVKVYKD